jgi:glycosyltransferase involved in cell wall biosynthesis
MSSPFFSVIVPACYSQSTITRALLSLENQSFKDFEVILIADDDIDYSSLLINSILNITFLRTKKVKSGPSTARNVGLSAATGRYVCYLDADDEFSSNRLELFKNAHEEYKTVGDVIEIHGDDGSVINRSLNSAEELDLLSYLKKNFPIKISHLRCQEVNFDELVFFAEDTLFNARLMHFLEEPLHIVKESKYIYHQHTNSLTAQSYESIDKGYMLLIDQVENLFSDKGMSNIFKKQFWVKRMINKLYFDYSNSFGCISFYDFVELVGLEK